CDIQHRPYVPTILLPLLKRTTIVRPTVASVYERIKPLHIYPLNCYLLSQRRP
ncbi:hypothetical protein J6590_029835, partial [Homalodisca vitripennis]